MTDITELAERLSAVPSPNAREILARHGVTRTMIHGLAPICGIDGPVAGRARTVRYLPAREDLGKTPRGQLSRQAFDEVEAGEVLVIDAGGALDGAVMGDMMAARATTRGCHGVFADGVVRDIDGVEPLGLPTFARDVIPDPWMTRLMPWELQEPVCCGGVLVMPGDWILADATAMIVIPAALLETVLDEDEAARDEERFSQALIEVGHKLDDAYPLPQHMREHLAKFSEDGTVPPVAQES